MTRKLLHVCDILGPCRLSCTCVDSNLDPFTLLLWKCVNVEKTHVESTDFNFWFNICWFRRVKIVSIRCIFGFVLSFRTTFVGVHRFSSSPELVDTFVRNRDGHFSALVAVNGFFCVFFRIFRAPPVVAEWSASFRSPSTMKSSSSSRAHAN